MSQNLLVKVTGSIAAFKTPLIVSHFVKAGWNVRIVMSESAKKFVGATTFEGLCDHPVYDDLWTRGKAMDHIHLDRWADKILLCPASANTLNKFAAGIADDIVSSLFLAHEFETPYFIAPAMNRQMWNHPTTKESVRKLKAMGLKFLEPEQGQLACGESGDGRLMEPEKIISCLEEQTAPLNVGDSKRVIITMGGTAEPVDDVRSLTNFSTGKTGSFIAEQLATRGFDVTALSSSNSPQLSKVITQHYFKSADELEALLKAELSRETYAVVQAAAISDYSVQPSKGKLDSQSEQTIKLIPREKTIAKIKPWSPRPIKLIGFKLLVDASEEQLQEASGKVLEYADLVVANDKNRISDQQHAFWLFDKNGKLGAGNYKMELVESLIEWLIEEKAR